MLFRIYSSETSKYGSRVQILHPGNRFPNKLYLWPKRQRAPTRRPKNCGFLCGLNFPELRSHVGDKPSKCRAACPQNGTDCGFKRVITLYKKKPNVGEKQNERRDISALFSGNIRTNTDPRGIRAHTVPRKIKAGMLLAFVTGTCGGGFKRAHGEAGRLYNNSYLFGI